MKLILMLSCPTAVRAVLYKAISAINLAIKPICKTRGGLYTIFPSCEID